MRTLYLLRHAKSSWEDASLRDHDRPLAPRGRRGAAAMARMMRDEGWSPELVLCSTAVRTRETWDLMAPLLGGDVPVEYQRRLYGASAATLLDSVRELPDGIRRASILAHNPGIERLALALAGKGPSPDLERLERKFPTAAVAVLEADLAHWSGMAPGRCELVRFVRPKDLPEADAERL